MVLLHSISYFYFSNVTVKYLCVDVELEIEHMNFVFFFTIIHLYNIFLDFHIISWFCSVFSFIPKTHVLKLIYLTLMS